MLRPHSAGRIHTRDEIGFGKFAWNKCNVVSGMIISKKMFRDCCGFGDIRWVVNWSPAFFETLLKSSSSFSDVLFEAMIPLSNVHVNNVFRVAGDLKGHRSGFTCRVERL